MRATTETKLYNKSWQEEATVKLEHINFFTRYSTERQQTLLRTNGQELILKDVKNIFLGTYAGHNKHANDRELNAGGLTLLWINGWQLDTLLQYLQRLNAPGNTIDSSVFTREVG